MYGRRRAAFAAAALGALVLAGCGASSSTSTSSTSSASTAAVPSGALVPASLAAEAKAHPLSPYPTQRTSLPTVTIGQSVPSLSFAPLDIAEAMNFFGYLGVPVKYDTLQSGATMQEAVVGGSIAIGADASSDVSEMNTKGISGVAIADIMPMTAQVCVNKTWIRQHGLSASQSVTQRAKGMKGAAFGITGPGALTDAAARWLVKDYGGINPDTGINAITVGFSSLAPSLDANKIQAFVASPPACELTTQGEVLINPSQVPQWKDYTNEVLFTTKSYAASNPDITTRIATAADMGAEFIFAHPAKAVELMEKLYPTTNPSLIAAAFQQGILPVAKNTVAFTPSMWTNVNSVLVGGGSISKPVDTAPGGVWTNEYIDTSAAKVY